MVIRAVQLILDEILASHSTGGVDRLFPHRIADIETLFRQLTEELNDLRLTVKEENEHSLEPVISETPPAPTRAETLVSLAAAEWSRGVVEPKGSNPNQAAHILKYISQGLAWPAPKNYTNGSFQWCGAFVAYIYSKVGLREDIRKYWLPSCNRQYFGHRTRGHLPRNHTVYEYNKHGSPGNIQPGDIVMVGRVDGPPSGSHITLCVSDPHTTRSGEWSYIQTIEGNAVGSIPGGKTAEGVVRQQRYFSPDSGYHIKWAWRPTDDMFEEVK